MRNIYLKSSAVLQHDAPQNVRCLDNVNQSATNNKSMSDSSEFLLMQSRWLTKTNENHLIWKMLLKWLHWLNARSRNKDLSQNCKNLWKQIPALSKWELKSKIKWTGCDWRSMCSLAANQSARQLQSKVEFSFQSKVQLQLDVAALICHNKDAKTLTEDCKVRQDRDKMLPESRLSLERKIWL